ncbi:putative arabinose 5-phosphate isomerase [Chlorella sorokiniana]|uniref:Arabinose 5-phosphate isomerase n=1 Tax=Chlorella sorokiniana TaxID=3076 RepID=A0A2P6TJ58_CHLSO|nr:putative arabinose 5-phosphate isomerase [Chlorella sorokiniana]|eukprot:PRW39284.1 putative arabinose 5-phosphate isomerase [Chlorella sorokiniana]
MVAAAEAVSLQPVVGHLEQPQGMAQQRQAPQPQVKGTDPAAAAPPNSPVASDGLGQLFRRQQRYLNYFFDNLDFEPVQQFCQACLTCTGVVIFTGVGKSGLISQKICQTLVSTGTKAVFLSPQDALHGDIGIIGPHDLLVCFSKSGATEEIIRLVPFAKAKGARLVSITSVPGSPLEELCDLAVHLPLERELCPFDLAPVTSTAIQMIFGDTVAIALMQAKHLTRDQYAMNHPAGRIGKRLMLRVADVMIRNGAVPVVLPDMLMPQVLVELTGKSCGCVLVADADLSLAGIFTDGDLRRTLQQCGADGRDIMQLRVAEVMTRTPKTICSQEMAVDAMQIMERGPKVAMLPVVDEGKVQGLITLHGLVSAGL